MHIYAHSMYLFLFTVCCGHFVFIRISMYLVFKDELPNISISDNITKQNFIVC